jgi:hypothetical protein
MEPSLSKLAETLDRLSKAGRVVVSETRERIAANQLTGPEAAELMKLLEEAGWGDAAAEDQGGTIPTEMLPKTGGEDVRISAAKPEPLAATHSALTRSGFIALLGRPPIGPTVWVGRLKTAVETTTVRYAPWGDTSAFTPKEAAPDPARVVRLLGPGGPGSDLGRWMLRDPATKTDDPALAPWREEATKRLASALAQEIESDGRLLFRGPPPTRFRLDDADALTNEAFRSLQRAAEWVYFNDRELENRHALLAAEMARTAVRDGNLPDLAAVAGPALEGARIAYQFGVTEQSKDTLKALSELRKAVSDEAAKLSETTRSLGAAVVGAVFGNIALIVARLTLPANAQFVGAAAVLLGVVLTIYVGATIASGIQYLSIQRDLRRDWKLRLYRFLSDAEYEAMVGRPAARAEFGFKIAPWSGGIMSLVLLIAVYLIATADHSNTQPITSSVENSAAPTGNATSPSKRRKPPFLRSEKMDQCS